MVLLASVERVLQAAVNVDDALVGPVFGWISANLGTRSKKKRRERKEDAKRSAYQIYINKRSERERERESESERERATKR